MVVCYDAILTFDLRLLTNIVVFHEYFQSVMKMAWEQETEISDLNNKV